MSVQSTDGRGLQFSKTLIITVNNLLESGRGIPTTVADFKFTGGSLDSSDADPTTSADLASGGGAGYFITGTSSQYLRSTTTDNNPNSSTAKRDNGQYVSGVHRSKREVSQPREFLYAGATRREFPGPVDRFRDA